MFPLQEGYLKYPVRITLDGKPAGSGFFIEKDHVIYLVTARHVLADTSCSFIGSKVLVTAFSNQTGFDDRIEITFDLNDLNNRKAIKIHPSRDIVVIKIGDWDHALKVVALTGVNLVRSGQGDLMVAQDTMFRKFDQVEISNDIYLFGYPTAIGLKGANTVLNLEKPLLRKGIIAGKDSKFKLFTLDCPAFGGNSGGPVTEVIHLFHDDGRYEGMGVYIVGIVTEFVPYSQTFLDPLLGIPGQVIGNSSYSIAEPIDAILELLK